MAVAKGPGWYAGTIQVASASQRLAGGSTDTPTVFYWGKATVPTVAAVNVTDLVNITGGPFKTKAEAQGGAAHSAKGSSEPATTPSTSTPGSSGSLSNPLDSILGFLQGFTEQNLWIRVAKVIGGGVVLVVGLVKLTGVDQKAPGIIRTAVKAAPLL